MAFARGPQVIQDGLCFYFDSLNKKCYSGTGLEFTELISKTKTTAVVNATSSIQLTNKHLEFISDGTDRSCYIPFPNNDITVPTGNEGTWLWFQMMDDKSDRDHVNISKSTDGTWNGTDGFVFGTGWGVDGPRWGVGGENHSVYADVTSINRYINKKWQCWCVTFKGTTVNGIKTYLDGNLIDERDTTAPIIGSNSLDLYLGAPQIGDGLWEGYMDVVQMWTRALSSGEVQQNFNMFKRRFE